MTIRERISAQREQEFLEEFDLKTFDHYVEEMITKYHHVTIGLENDNCFDGYLKNKKQKDNWSSGSKWLTFAYDHNCYVWSTSCQIPRKFVENVKKHLREQGLRTTLKGACGYETYDVMEITL